MKLPPIHYSTYIARPLEQVWAALTTGVGWNAWFTTEAYIEARAGGSYRFSWRGFGPGLVDLDLTGRVLDASDPNHFSFEWGSGEGRTTVAFELSARGAGTVVRVTESGYSSSPKDVLACLECAAGWGEALTLLKFWLEHGVRYGAVPPLP